MSAPPVVAENLGKDYREGRLRRRVCRALEELTFTIPHGSIFGLIGPNGAGKSTTLHLMVGFMAPSRGRVSLFGLPPTEPDARRGLGFLPEVFAYDPFATGTRLLERFDAFSGRGVEGRRERVLNALFAVDLAAEGSHRVRTYSKGMTQRIGLAQAILGDPELLILDEPMSGMDPATRHAVKEMLLMRKRRGKSTLFSSHILTDVEDLADRILILKHGRCLYEGSVAGLTGGVGGVTITFRKEGPVGALPPEIGEPRTSAEPGLWALEIADRSSTSLALRQLLDQGADIVSVVPRQTTLETRFLDLLGPGSHG